MAQEFDSSFPSLPSQNLKGESHSSAEDKFSNEATSQHSSPSDHKDNYEHLDHSQLKALCKDKGYATSGKTNTLIQRLRTHDARAMGAEGKESKDSSRSSTQGAGWLDSIRGMVDLGVFVIVDTGVFIGLAVVSFALVAQLVWLYMKDNARYSTLITFIEWRSIIVGWIPLGLGVALGIGKFLFFKPRSGNLQLIRRFLSRRHRLITGLIRRPNDPQEWSADSQEHLASTSHTSRSEQASSHPRLDSNRDSSCHPRFDSNRDSCTLDVSETRLPDTTQPPRSPITQTSGGKGLGIPLHEEDSHTTQSLPPLPPTSSKASVTVNLSDTLPAPIPLPQSLSTNNIGELERFSYDAQSIDADLSHELNALTNDPNWNVPRDQQDSDTILSLSSLPPTPRTLAQIPKRFLVHKTLTAISDKEEAIRDRDKCNDLNVQLSQQIFDKAEEEKDKETLNQRALEDQRLRIMFEQFDKRPNVWVVVRFRDKIPSDDGEAPLHYSHARKECHQELSIYRWQDDWVDETQRKKVPSVKERMAPKPYIVDHVFEPSASNIQVFETMKPLIKMFLDGRQICIIADGQSGTGKSYTMLNGPEPIAASAAHMIFDDLNSTKLSGWEYSIECSILEICQERPKDLLHDNKLPAQTNDWIQESIFAPKDIRIQRSDPGLVGCSRHHLKSAKEFIALIRKASKLRTTRKTEKNKHSSRSDLISIISISRSDMITKENIRARFYLVDLVGSESSSDPLLKNTLEVNTIKKGRESLKRAMSAHRNHDDHIPLDNQLTLLLQDCFKAPSKIVLLVTASPLLKDQSTTSTMIDFASEARNYEGKVKSKTSAK